MTNQLLQLLRTMSLIPLLGLAAGALGACSSDEPDFVPITFDDDTPAKNGKAPAKGKSKSGNTAKPTSTGSSPERGAPEAQAIEAGDVVVLRKRASVVHAALVSALPAREQRLVADVPFTFLDARGEVNAFAACTAKGPVISVTDGLMQVQSQLARAAANDEVFKTNKLESYLTQLSRSPTLLPPKGFIDASQDQNATKRARQEQLLDEGLAFVIGHELAHHRLSHTGCVGNDRTNTTAADVGRLLSRRVPLFNQPNELSADVYGIENVLNAGKTTGSHWSEGGALLMLKAFRARSQMSLADALVFGFERTHPHPDVRIPTVEQTATLWRASGGRKLPKLPNLVLDR